VSIPVLISSIAPTLEVASRRETEIATTSGLVEKPITMP